MSLDSLRRRKPAPPAAIRRRCCFTGMNCWDELPGQDGAERVKGREVKSWGEWVRIPDGKRMNESRIKIRGPMGCETGGLAGPPVGEAGSGWKDGAEVRCAVLCFRVWGWAAGFFSRAGDCARRGWRVARRGVSRAGVRDVPYDGVEDVHFGVDEGELGVDEGGVLGAFLDFGFVVGMDLVESVAVLAEIGDEGGIDAEGEETGAEGGAEQVRGGRGNRCEGGAEQVRGWRGVAARVARSRCEVGAEQVQVLRDSLKIGRDAFPTRPAREKRMTNASRVSSSSSPAPDLSEKGPCPGNFQTVSEENVRQVSSLHLEVT